MKSGIHMRAVKLGVAFVLVALLSWSSAWLPLGLAGTAAAQEGEAKSEATGTTTPPYSGLQACQVGMELGTGEGCHVSGSETSVVVGNGSACVALFNPTFLVICHATQIDSSTVVSASKDDGGGWIIDELAGAPGSCGELKGLHEAVRLGNAEWVTCLATTGADVNARDERGDTPLHIAVEKEDAELTQILIAAGADVSMLSYGESSVPIGLETLSQIFASTGSEVNVQDAEIIAKAERSVEPLEVAVEYGAIEIVQMLVVASLATPEPASISTPEAMSEQTATSTPTPRTINPALSKAGFMGNTLLHDAIEEGDADLVRALVEAGADINKEGFMSATPLHDAIEKGNAEIVQILVDAGADINKGGHMGTTPLGLAIEKGDDEIVKILLGAAGNVTPEPAVSEQDASGRTPLHIAVEDGDTELVQTLIASGANVNATDPSEQTPLHIAVQNGDAELVRILAEAGADVRAKDASDKTPLSIATENGDLEIVEIIVDAISAMPAPSAPPQPTATPTPAASGGSSG